METSTIIFKPSKHKPMRAISSRSFNGHDVKTITTKVGAIAGTNIVMTTSTWMDHNGNHRTKQTSRECGIWTQKACEERHEKDLKRHKHLIKLIIMDHSTQ